MFANNAMFPVEAMPVSMAT